MEGMTQDPIIGEYFDFIRSKSYPCVMAKASLETDHIHCFVADHMACPHDDRAILDFLYDFIDKCRADTENYYSAAVLFRGPKLPAEEAFDALLWQRLQSLADMDAQTYGYDARVSSDTSSANFSFSLKEEAFFVIGMHPASSRKARQFSYPVLVFNSHAQFERLRETEKYEHLKSAIRKRDITLSGSINPMLEDFGNAPEVFQYSGRKYDEGWTCPLKINHRDTR